MTPARRPTLQVRVERMKGSVAGAAGRAADWRAGSIALRTVHRYLVLNGTERALVIGAQAFSALIPLLIVLSTVVSSGGPQLANSFIERFQLSGNSADAIRTLFAQPPGAAQNVTIGSAVLLVAAGLGLARTLQRTYEAAWRLPAQGLRGTAGGMAALALLVTQVLLLSLLAGFLRAAPASSALTLLVRTPASCALWLVLQYVLLGGRIGWRRLLPGAVAAGLGQQIAAELSNLWIPHVVRDNATQYGAIGVSFALLSWLVLIAVVIVVGSSLSVELGGGPPLPVPAGHSGSRLLGTLGELLGSHEADQADPKE